MDKGDSGSIFDEAARARKKKRLLRKKKLDPSHAPAPKTSSSATVPMDDEFKEMFAKMRDMREDLEGRVLDLYAKAGVSRTVAETFFADAKNVPVEKKSVIENEIAKLEKQLTDILGTRTKKVTQQFKEDKDSDKRKKKLIGQRRKWLQM